MQQAKHPRWAYMLFLPDAELSGSPNEVLEHLLDSGLVTVDCQVEGGAWEADGTWTTEVGQTFSMQAGPTNQIDLFNSPCPCR